MIKFLVILSIFRKLFFIGQNLKHVHMTHSFFELLILFWLINSKYLAFEVSEAAVHRSSRPEVFCAKGVLTNFAKFTGKHLCQSLLYNKLADLRPATFTARKTIFPGISWKAQKDQVNIFPSTFWLKKGRISHHWKVQKKNFSVISKYHLSINFLAQKETVFPIPEKVKTRTFQ